MSCYRISMARGDAYVHVFFVTPTKTRDFASCTVNV